MSNYNWRVQVRITGTRNGWGRTLVDTPAFELRSNAQFGAIWSSADTVAAVAHAMFVELTQPDDQVHVTVCAAEPRDDDGRYAPVNTNGDPVAAFTFGGLGA